MTKIKSDITVIIPMHNVEDFLPKCLDALIEQTHREIEIICVDDNSSDDTMAVAKKYADRDKRVRVAKSHARGASVARNLGIDMAKSDYIMFCDADDYYEPDACADMLKAIEDSGASVAICEINTIYHVRPQQKMWDQDYYNLKFRGLHTINAGMLPQIDVAPTNKIFRKSIIDEYKIRFPEGRSYEDAYFCYAYFCVGKTLYFLNKRLYNYIRHPDSTMVKTWSEEADFDRAIDHLYVGILFYDFLEKYNLFKEYSHLFWDRFRFCEHFSLNMSKSKERTQLTKEVATDFIKKHLSDFYLAPPAIRNDLIDINPGLRFIDGSWLKRRILKFMPAYRLQLNNIERLKALTWQNEKLLQKFNQSK